MLTIVCTVHAQYQLNFFLAKTISNCPSAVDTPENALTGFFVLAARPSALTKTVRAGVLATLASARGLSP